MRIPGCIGATSAILFAASLTADVSFANELPYRFEAPNGFDIKILTNPCLFSDSINCCNESYGAAEYVQ